VLTVDVYGLIRTFVGGAQYLLGSVAANEKRRLQQKKAFITE